MVGCFFVAIMVDYFDVLDDIWFIRMIGHLDDLDDIWFIFIIHYDRVPVFRVNFIQ